MKKIRLVAICSALATGATIITLLPSADAADPKTPEQIMDMCNRSAVIAGKPRETRDFGGTLGDGFAADNCEFVETNFEVFDGPTQKVTVDFPNCEPNATAPAKVTTEWSRALAQGKGKYEVTRQGVSVELFGLLSGSWVKHKGTLDMNIDSTVAKESEEREVPVGKVLHVEFTPKMARMTGEWRVKINARPATTTNNPVPEQNFAAPDIVEGPLIRPGVAGAPGLADGVSKAVLTNC